MSKRRIFSGYHQGSKQLWKAINKLNRRKRNKPAFWATYILACRCQELETVVEKLTKRVEALERND